MNNRHPRLNQVVEDLKRRFSSHLKQVVIFGSQARGEASPESDWDCLLVFDEVTPAIKVELEQLAGHYLLHQGLVLSCIAVSQLDLERLRFEPFLINAQKEGIAQ